MEFSGSYAEKVQHTFIGILQIDETAMTGIHELQNLLDKLRSGNRIRGRDVNRQSREPVLRPIQALVPLGRIVPLKRWHRLEVLKKLSTSFVDSNFRRSFRELCPLSLSLSGEEELEEDESDELDDEGSEGGFFDFFLLL